MRSTEHLPAGTSSAWSLRSRHSSRQRSGAGDRGRSPKKMNALKLILFTLIWSCIAASAEMPKTEDKHWENACGGSNIAVTSVGGKIVSIDAFVEHFSEGRQWVCHFKDGKIISALYRHFEVTRKLVGDAGEFTTELDEDKVEVFHFPEHQLAKIDPALKKDLSQVIAIATNQGEQGDADQPATAVESKAEGKEKPKSESEGRAQ